MKDGKPTPTEASKPHAFRQLTELRVFAASPRDVSEERRRLRAVIEELNRGTARQQGVVLQPVGWDTSVRPGVGSDSQEVVSRQIGPYHIFVGIMWKYFGTPTPRAGSGTEEEFDQAYSLWSKQGWPRILFYFNQDPFFPSSEEGAEQLCKVMAFRKKVGRKGVLYCEYCGPEDFERFVREHLIMVILKWEEDSKMAEVRREVMFDVVGLGEGATRGDLSARVCEIVSARVPNADVCLYICDDADPSMARQKASNSEAFILCLKQTWRVVETPFVADLNTDLGTHLILEARNSRGRLEGFLVLETASVEDDAGRLSGMDRLWLDNLASRVGDALYGQRTGCLDPIKIRE